MAIFKRFKVVGVPPCVQIKTVSSIWYQCQRCGNCCRWPGEVKLQDSEIPAIADFLELAPHDFIQNHTRLQVSRRGLALLDKPNGECAYLDGIDCRLQSVKPIQCRGFPNEWNFPGWRETCEAIPIEKALEK